MFRKSALALLLTAALATPALADQCYSSAQTRQMVQQGQAVPLSGVLGQINAIGKIVSSDALLCNVGGRLVYLIDVIQNGNVIHVQVDAQSGQITY
jgi:hypothetical protein